MRSIKNISDDLEFLKNDNINDFDYLKLEPEDIEFESINEEEGHRLEHSKNSTSASTPLLGNRSH